MIKHYFKTALRNIKKSKIYFLINVGGLALGMISCIYITLWVRDELGWDRFHENYHKLYRFTPQMTDGTHSWTPLALVPSLRGKFPEIDTMTRFSRKKYNIRFGDTDVSENGGLIDRTFFDIFSFPLYRGDIQDNFNDSTSIVLTERLAGKLFPSGDPIGQPVIVNNGKRFIVTGIMKNVPENSHLQFDFLLPIRQMREGADTDWSYDCFSYFTLKDKTNPDVFQKKISHFISENDKMDHNVLLKIQSFGHIHLHSLNGTDPIVYIYIFMGLALIILLIACINFINISTSRSVFRAKEIGIRKVAGAQKKEIIRQFMGESAAMSMAALFLSIIGACFLFPWLNRLSGKQILPGDFFTPVNILGALVLGIVTGLGSGIYPALRLSSIAPVKTVKGTFRHTAGSTRLSRVFVSSQFTVTVILIITTLTMYRQLNFMLNRDLGFKRDQVISIPMNDALRDNYPLLKENLKRHTGIINVTSAYNNPTDIYHSNVINWKGNPAGKPVTVKDQSVDYDYFDLFQMEIVRGRSFSREFPTDRDGFILNQTAAALTGYNDPIGRPVTVWAKEGKIIGVVRDFHSSSFHQKIKPTVFMLSERHGRRTRMFVKLRAQDITGSLGYIRQTLSRLAPDSHFEYTFLDDVFAGQYAKDQRLGNLYCTFTILAVIISCLGLYGMVSLILSGKTREFGIRKVLGSTVTGIITLVSREFLTLISLSTLIGWPVSYLVVNSILSRYQYRAGISIWIFLAAWIMVLFLAALSIGGRVLRSARANPLNSLKYE